MKTIFDSETELAAAGPEHWGWEAGDIPDAELLDGHIVAHTRADLNHARGLLKLEQRVYIRAGAHVLEQSWLPPEMLIESVDDDDAARALAERLHQHYCDHARQHLNEGLHAFA